MSQRAAAPLEFFYLVMACSMTVREAARRYARSERTIRLWCEDLPISCRVAGGPHRISAPLADLYAAGERRALAEFLDGAKARQVVCDAFEHHGVLQALADFQQKRLLAEATENLTRRQLRQARQS